MNQAERNGAECNRIHWNERIGKIPARIFLLGVSRVDVDKSQLLVVPKP